MRFVIWLSPQFSRTFTASSLVDSMRPVAKLAARIGRELLSVSGGSRSTRTWDPSLEQTLHRLGRRDSLSPSLVARVIDPFLLKHHSLALGFFNWAAQQPGFSHDSVSYRSIFRSLSLSRQFSAMDALLKQVRSQKIVFESAVYQSLIDSFVLGRKTQSAFWVFDQAVSLRWEICPAVCNRLLAALASDGYSDCAHKVLGEMRQRGISLNTIGFGVYIRRFCRNAEMGQLLSLVDEVKKANSNVNGSIIALLIVHGLCKSSREMDAFWVLDELRKIDCKPDFMAYRVIAEAFQLTGNLYERQVVLKKKRKLGVAPRSRDYRDFVLDLISAMQITEAKEMAEVIVSGNFPIDGDVLNALIGSVSAIDPDSAVGFLNFMICKGKMPTLVTLTNLSRSLCRHDKSDELMKVYEVLSSNDYFSDLESYNVMVSFLCKAGRVREAYSALHRMKKKGWDPDVTMYNTIMEACCREDLIRPAKRLWDEMFANGSSINLKTYNILIGKLSQEGQADEALRLLQHMLEKGIEPDPTTYTSLLEGLCQEKKLEAAFEIFRQTVKKDKSLSRSVLSTFVLSLCRNGHFTDASQLLRDLGSVEGHLEHPGSHAVLLKCLAEAKEAQIGIKHIKWVKEASPSLAHAISSELLASICSSTNPDLVSPLLHALGETNAEYVDTPCDDWQDNAADNESGKIL